MKCTIAGCTNNKGKGISASAESGSNLNKHLRPSHKPDAERLIAEIKNKPSSSVGGGDLSSSDQTRIETPFWQTREGCIRCVVPCRTLNHKRLSALQHCWGGRFPQLFGDLEARGKTALKKDRCPGCKGIHQWNSLTDPFYKMKFEVQNPQLYDVWRILSKWGW